MTFPRVVVAAALVLCKGSGCGKPIVPAKPTASKSKAFERLDGCRLVANRWNDGDSFHMRIPDGLEIVARRYFVDTNEDETKYRDRIAEQAEYFGITAAEVATIVRAASPDVFVNWC